MIGFLPSWLALGGLAGAWGMVGATLAARRPLPGWLVPLAVLLALGKAVV